MKVLVLGADGFVGNRVVAALAASDWAQPIKHNVPAQLDAELADVDAVANCVSGRPGDITKAAHVLFAAAARSARAIPIVHLSSMTVYGSASGVLDEESALLPDLGAYAQAQQEAANVESVTVTGTLIKGINRRN